jgi:hypothetical protein
VAEERGAGVDLYWLPLGAGGRSVRVNGRVYEAIVSRLERRSPCDLYHAGLAVRVDEGCFVIEVTPVPRGDGAARGAVVVGAVGSRLARRLRVFRYEVRRWRDGVIPDVDEAVESPARLTGDAQVAQRVLELVPAVPALTWGRDESRAGEMWNSNSVVSWVLARCKLLDRAGSPPERGRAPGWRAGIVAADRGLERD